MEPNLSKHSCPDGWLSPFRPHELFCKMCGQLLRAGFPVRLRIDPISSRPELATKQISVPVRITNIGEEDCELGEAKADVEGISFDSPERVAGVILSSKGGKGSSLEVIVRIDPWQVPPDRRSAKVTISARPPGMRSFVTAEAELIWQCRWEGRDGPLLLVEPSKVEWLGLSVLNLHPFVFGGVARAVVLEIKAPQGEARKAGMFKDQDRQDRFVAAFPLSEGTPCEYRFIVDGVPQPDPNNLPDKDSGISGWSRLRVETGNPLKLRVRVFASSQVSLEARPEHPWLEVEVPQSIALSGDRREVFVRARVDLLQPGDHSSSVQLKACAGSRESTYKIPVHAVVKAPCPVPALVEPLYDLGQVYAGTTESELLIPVTNIGSGALRGSVQAADDSVRVVGETFVLPAGTASGVAKFRIKLQERVQGGQTQFNGTLTLRSETPFEERREQKFQVHYSIESMQFQPRVLALGVISPGDSRHWEAQVFRQSGHRLRGNLTVVSAPPGLGIQCQGNDIVRITVEGKVRPAESQVDGNIVLQETTTGMKGFLPVRAEWALPRARIQQLDLGVIEGHREGPWAVPLNNDGSGTLIVERAVSDAEWLEVKKADADRPTPLDAFADFSRGKPWGKGSHEAVVRLLTNDPSHPYADLKVTARLKRNVE